MVAEDLVKSVMNKAMKQNLHRHTWRCPARSLAAGLIVHEYGRPREEADETLHRTAYVNGDASATTASASQMAGHYMTSHAARICTYLGNHPRDGWKGGLFVPRTHATFMKYEIELYDAMACAINPRGCSPATTFSSKDVDVRDFNAVERSYWAAEKALGRPGDDRDCIRMAIGDFTGMAKVISALSAMLGASLVWLLFEDPELHRRLASSSALISKFMGLVPTPFVDELRDVYHAYNNNASGGETHPSPATLAAKMDAMTQHLVSLERTNADLHAYIRRTSGLPFSSDPGNGNGSATARISNLGNASNAGSAARQNAHTAPTGTISQANSSLARHRIKWYGLVYIYICVCT